MLALLLAAVFAAAPPPSPPNGPPPVRAVRAEGPIQVDGVLSEPVWRSAEPVTDLRQRDPDHGAPATERTEIRVAFDDDALYVGARLWDTRPDSILARLTRRDVDITADRFSVFLDPYHDRRSGYYFEVNAAGVQYDGTLFNDNWDDSSWDGVWEGRARLDAEGWSVEMRIPFSQLRFSNGGSGTWGVNFRRTLPRRIEDDFLAVPPRDESGFVSRFPHLLGLDGVQPRSTVEIVPYVTGKAEYLVRAAADPFHDGSRMAPNAGADLRMPLGSRLTLNATINPDFGQVEVDPAIVNLSDVEAFFQEKRPFFVENAQVFRFGNEGASDYWGFNWPEPGFFYSRRIGRAPQGSVPDSHYTDYPLATTILGAAKVTGKLAPTWNFGMLHALTAKESADLATAAGVESEAEIEPLTYYGVARAQKEFAGRRHGLGFMANLMARRFDEARLEPELTRTSTLAALDGWTFLDRDRTWVLSGWSAASLVAGSKERIADLQRSSRRYYQRPDADHLDYDPERTSLAGGGARAWLNKEKGRWFGNSAFGLMSPGFDVNEMGFHTRSDVINAHSGWGYRWSDPGRFRKRGYVLGALFGSWDFGGVNTSRGAWFGGSTEFRNSYSTEYNLGLYAPTSSNRLTRGGPLVRIPAGFDLSAYFDTDSKSRLFYFVSADLGGRDEGDTWNWSVSPGVEWKPASNLTLRVGPGFERQAEDVQYVTTVDDPTATATYAARYVFARLDQKTASANVRLNWAFTPGLSLQLYAQPLISSGRYTGYKELARPDTYEFLVYGTNGSTFDPATNTADPDGAGPAPPIALDPPDFNFKSLRGNAVLRWEYRPGSAFYLVWTQERVDFEPEGEFRFSRSVDRLFERQPENIFLAKLTYYLAP